MIEVLKIVKGHDKLKHKILFRLQGIGKTRRHRFKLNKDRSRLEIRRNFFSQRVAKQWNGLPGSVVEAESVNSVKNRYDKCIRERNSRLRE